MDYMREYEKWLASPALTPEEHAELESIRGDEKEIRERFYGPLEFGTAGLRGTMKAGLHQMNVHVIRWATQGFANVICAEGEEAKRRGVALCMDCRNHSMEFARAAAEVCAANGIHVRIFESLRPTRELLRSQELEPSELALELAGSDHCGRLIVTAAEILTDMLEEA